nr:MULTISPECIES: DUF2142 domain-containing protein [unclassified Actinomyces]
MSHRAGTRRPGPRAGRRRLLLTWLTVLSLLGVGLGWVVSSPLGGSPDDDYHLTSIWCPQPVEESCRTATIDGEIRVEVPERIGDNSPCYAFHPETSAECSLHFSDGKTRWAYRYDAGNYPGGFYRLHHLLVSPRVIVSVLAMRAVNVVLAVGLLSAIGVLLPAAVRRAYVLAAAASLVPLGVYFIASNNPSSWALTGVLAYAAALYGATRTGGGRAWALTGLAGLGALLCCLSRFDAAFYLFVVSMAYLFLVRWRRRHWPQCVLALLASAAGLYLMLLGGAGGHSGPADPAAADPGLVRATLEALYRIPSYMFGMYGLGFGAGWADIHFEWAVPACMILTAGAVCMLGLRSWSWRKGLAILMVAGAMTGMPVVMSVMGIFPGLVGYQPRYALPLLPVLLLILLVDHTSPDGEQDSGAGGISPITRAQAILVVITMWVAATWAHYTVLQRYVQGMDEPDLINLDHEPEWWWDIPVSPMTVWALTLVATTVVTVGVVHVLSSRPSDEGDVAPTAEPAPTPASGLATADDKAPGPQETDETVTVLVDESEAVS